MVKLEEVKPLVLVFKVSFKSLLIEEVACSRLEVGLSLVKVFTEQPIVLRATIVFITPDCLQEVAYEELLVLEF